MACSSLSVDALVFTAFGQIERKPDDPEEETDEKPAHWAEVSHTLNLSLLYPNGLSVDQNPNARRYHNDPEILGHNELSFCLSGNTRLPNYSDALFSPPRRQPRGANRRGHLDPLQHANITQSLHCLSCACISLTMLPIIRKIRSGSGSEGDEFDEDA